MLALCVKASHQQGMGHLYRMLNLIECLRERALAHVVLVNDYKPSLEILQQRKIFHEVVPVDDLEGGWESQVIETHRIKVWVNDRLDTDVAHAKRVNRAGVRLVTFDDHGSGAALSDLHFAGLTFEGSGCLKGGKVFSGINYLVLNPEIERFKRHRSAAKRILVTLGGTDTYGVTVDVVGMLEKLNREATVVLGPGFRNHEALLERKRPGFLLMTAVPSLVEEFGRHDLAVTGGGVTPFEANASGLPCLTIASEPFEVEPCRFLEKLGTSIFLGHRNELNALALESAIRRAPIGDMSSLGMARIGTGGARNIVSEIEKL